MPRNDRRFARLMFRGAAIYGVLVLVPMYALAAPTDRPEVYYGFIGCALVFQWLFWIIGGDPVRHRPLMLVAAAEKVVFSLPALALIFVASTAPVVAPFAIIDLLLAVGFLVARSRTSA